MAPDRIVGESVNLYEVWGWLARNGLYIIGLFLALGIKALKKSFDTVPIMQQVIDQLLEVKKDHEERIRKLEQK